MECCVSQAKKTIFFYVKGLPLPLETSCFALVANRSQVLARRTDVRLVPVLSATPPYGGIRNKSVRMQFRAHPRNAPVETRHALPTINRERAVHCQHD